MTDDFLCVCPNWSVVTLKEVDLCPACGNGDERLTLAFEDPDP